VAEFNGNAGQSPAVSKCHLHATNGVVGELGDHVGMEGGRGCSPRRGAGVDVGSVVLNRAGNVTALPLY